MASFATCIEVSPLCPVEATTYGYYPNFGANVFFTAFFGFLGVIQLGWGIYYRTWTFLVAVAVGAFMEMAGYIGRIMMNDNPWSSPAFKLQIVCLVLAPSFTAAGIYLCLKHIVLRLGPEHSRLKPKLFTWIFISCDIVSLLLQAAGGGVAASAGNADTEMLDAGNNIIITGIAFQVATMAVCGVVALDFFIRYWKNERDSSVEKHATTDDVINANAPRGVKLMVGAEIFAYFTVLIRCIYRWVLDFLNHSFEKFPQYTELGKLTFDI